jgi:hypothetical protein
VANIDVVPKKSSTGWMMWVLLAIVALMVVWLLMRGNDANQTSWLNHAEDDLSTAAVTLIERT